MLEGNDNVIPFQDVRSLNISKKRDRRIDLLKARTSKLLLLRDIREQIEAIESDIIEYNAKNQEAHERCCDQKAVSISDFEYRNIDKKRKKRRELLKTRATELMELRKIRIEVDEIEREISEYNKKLSK